KRDSLVTRPREPMPPLPPASAVEPEAPAEAVKKEENTRRFDPYYQYEFVTAPDERKQNPHIDLPYADIPPANRTPTAPPNSAAKDAAQLFFGADSMAGGRDSIAPWAPGEAPIVLATRGDPDIKQSALAPSSSGSENKGGESVASKGEVTGE